ncbi:MAG: hypothetical protein QOJ56_6065 [Mycobacterium sp.]|jgi:hypothetical protein|nr:hypothetical protein [Mycobacterium sp.]
MDLRTFRRNGPGLAECESEAAWRRLWGERRAHRSLDTRGPVSNVAASWPQFGYRGQTHSTLCAARAGKVSAYGAWLRGAYEVGRGDAMTVLYRYWHLASSSRRSAASPQQILRQLKPTTTPNAVTRLFVAQSTPLRDTNAQLRVRGQPVQTFVRRQLTGRRRLSEGCRASLRRHS